MIFSLFSLSAFAQEKSIEWDSGYEDSGRETFNYGGKLQLGSNTVSPGKRSDISGNDGVMFDYVYYDFSVGQSGYYSIETTSDYYNTCISQDIRNGVVYGDEEWFALDGDGFSIYLEEGNCIFGLVFYSYEWGLFNNDYNCELNIEFIAEEITDLQIEEECLEDIILGYHICTDYDEENTCGIPAKGKFIFNNGKEIGFDEYLSVKYGDDIAPGENEITFVLPNYQKSYTVQIKTVEDYIKNIEVGNADDIAVVKETFVPDVVYSIDPEYFELILTMPDGTKKTEYVDYYYDIELKGGKVLTVWCDYYQKDDGNWYLTVEIGNKEYLSIPCEKIPASFSDNFILYQDGIIEYTLIMLDDLSYYFSEALDMFSGLSINERAESISKGFTAIGSCYSELYELTGMFFDYIL